MRSIFNTLVALMMATALSGCSALSSAVNFVDAPATQVAVSSLEGLTVTVGKLTGGIACEVSSVSGATLAAESVPVFAVGEGARATTDAVYVASQLACATLGGTAAGAAPAGATGVVAATPTASLGRRFRVVRR